MATNSIILTLPKDEQEALALCGITQDSQLARIGPHALLRDLKAASAFFPNAIDAIPEFSRLEYICQQAAESAHLSHDDTKAMWKSTGGHHAHGTALPSDEPEPLRYSAATGRMLVDDHLGSNKALSLDERRKKDNPRDFSHAICSQHPLAIYLGAWATVFLVAAIIVLLLGVAGLLIGIEFQGKESVMVAAATVVVVLFYAIMLSMATCSTCRVSVFSFRRYPRHRKAHHIFLLGYTFATALYTIFFFRYRCPSCGTPQKLFGRRHRRSRR